MFYRQWKIRQKAIAFLKRFAIAFFVAIKQAFDLDFNSIKY
jgi:hypothetical protein